MANVAPGIIEADNHTIGNDLRRVTRWCRIAREEIDRAGA
jgi:hypothetical protein